MLAPPAGAGFSALLQPMGWPAAPGGGVDAGLWAAGPGTVCALMRDASTTPARIATMTSSLGQV